MDRQLSKSRGRKPRKNNNGYNSSVTKPISIGKEIRSALMQTKQPKWFYNDSTPTGLTTTALYFDQSAQITVGTAANQRVGSKIFIKYIHYALEMIVGDATQLVRFMVFRWRPDNGSDVPGTSEIFDGTFVCLSTLLKYSPSRFEVLYDNLWHLDTLAHPVKSANFNVRVNRPCQYLIGGNSGQDHIYAMYVCDSSIAPNPSIRIISQVNYVDLE
jgi:hypothetical protein